MRQGFIVQQAPQLENQMAYPTHRVLDTGQWKLAIRNFDGSELYHRLGSSILDWGRMFLRHVTMAQPECGFAWSKEVKADYLGHYLIGTAK